MGGRPRMVLNDVQKGQLAAYARLGIPMEEIGALIGISERKLWYEIKDDPILNALYKKAVSEANAIVARTLFELCQDKKEKRQIRQEDGTMKEKEVVVRPANLSAVIFWTKTRAKWNTQIPPMEGKDEHTIELDLGELDDDNEPEDK